MTSTISGAILVEFSFYHRGHNRLTLSKDASLSLVERSITATPPRVTIWLTTIIEQRSASYMSLCRSGF
jgi:hypothetical protein